MTQPAGFYQKNGKTRPITPKKGGAGPLVAAGVLVAGVLGVAGAGGEAASLFASRGGAGSSASAPNLAARKADAGKAARKGDAEGAWQRLGMRQLKKTAKQDAKCLAASFGQVRQFFLRTPCTSLDRILFAVGDGAGNNAVVSVAWVGFRTRGQAGDFTALIDVYGTGDIKPLSSGLLGLADIRFTGRHYGSARTGSQVAVAEAEPAGGHLAPDILKALAEVAAQFPRP
ncbi:MAG TPA: hypothetical protein VGR06_10465 [Actinophytocola sp.]|jgi:hypothetical protein|uniref:hypothetical protein n=1 Tax=Actinophytocola sp. TaxID=1872138 RepID=UPI002DFF2F4D|nr:hypothetical protein [Actinophytocola sp.]